MSAEAPFHFGTGDACLGIISILTATAYAGVPIASYLSGQYRRNLRFTEYSSRSRYAGFHNNAQPARFYQP